MDLKEANHSFVKNLMHGTKSEINFLDEAYFGGFTVENNIISSFSDESSLTVPKGTYIQDDNFLDDIKEIIDQLD